MIGEQAAVACVRKVVRFHERNKTYQYHHHQTILARVLDMKRALVIVARWLRSMDSFILAKFSCYVADLTFGDISRLEDAVGPPEIDPDEAELDPCVVS